MAEDPGTNGGGGGTIQLGGTAGSMCAISPSDLVGTIGNLITRIEDLEKIVSSVLGANLHANTLSDISSQVGWVYGVEYMGVPGWIQTSYGTLIPPPGFTMSSSGIQMWNSCTGTFQNFQAVVMDENGVLQWGADSIGSLCGEKVEDWDAAALLVEPDYYMYRQGISMTGGTPMELSRGLTKYADTGLSTDEGFSISVLTAQAGLYQVSCGGIWTITRSGSQTGIVMIGEIETEESPGSANNRGYVRQTNVSGFTYIGGVGDPSITVDSPSDSVTITHTFDLPAGALIVCSASIDATGSYSVSQRSGIYVSVTRLGKGSI